LLINKIAILAAKLLSITGGNDFDSIIDTSVNMLGLDARVIMTLDAIKLKMALSGEKS
jgi:hypothetical protein